MKQHIAALKYSDIVVNTYNNTGYTQVSGRNDADLEHSRDQVLLILKRF